MTKPNFGSLFAGVGGFDLGMESAGWSCAWQVEWDAQCQQVLRHHWPDVPKHGDVQTVDGTTLAPVDCITFGSPCQDLSVAGKRSGLKGDRSSLFYEAIRIIEEMRGATDSRFPRWAIWENVPGALSSNNGHDFAAVLDSLAAAGAVAIEWAVLDAQHFGVPQRRRRVFVVACFDSATAVRCPDPLLPVAESMPRDSQPSGTARETPPSNLTLSATSESSAWVSEHMTRQSHGEWALLGKASTLNTRWGDPSKSDLIATFSKSKRARTSDDDETWVEGAVAPTLNQFDQGDTRATVLAFSAGNSFAGGAFGLAEDQSPTLTAGRSGTNQAPTILAFGHNNGIDIQPSDTTYPTLRRKSGGAGVHTDAAVRRLMPVECERLMGWPDDHTRWGIDATGNVKEMSDSGRYRMIGNGVVAPVAAWLGRHLAAVDAVTA